MFREQLTGKESVVVVTPEKKYKCNHPNCSASFVRPNKLRAHERMHTNEVNFVLFSSNFKYFKLFIILKYIIILLKI